MKNYLIPLLAVLGLTACATPMDMAFKEDAEVASEKKNPVFLMTASMKNDYKTFFKPKVSIVYIEKPGAQIREERLNFKMDSKGRIEPAEDTEPNDYLVRFELVPGKYELRGMLSEAGGFPIRGFFYTPINASIEAPANGIYYLGHVKATVRERQGSEFKAGPTAPLLDQAVAGASGGTFDVEISDQWASDEARFLERFPTLNGVSVKKAIMPEFDRAKAQKWWEVH